MLMCTDPTFCNKMVIVLEIPIKFRVIDIMLKS